MKESSQTLAGNVDLLKAKASRQAIIGATISSVAVVVATLLSSYFQYGQLSLEGLIHVQKNNVLLWFLDTTPFLFAFWGQHVSSMMVYEAGEMVREQTEELRSKTSILESRAMHAVTHDSLTGLPNRVLFQDRLDQVLKNARIKGKKLAVLLLDLNRFKEINNTLGHYNGDKVLKQTADRIRELPLPGENYARMGGDEFAIMVSGINNEEDIQKIVSMIHRLMKPPVTIEGLNLELRVTIGVATSPEHGTDSDTLIQRADVARYVAKEKRKDFVVYSFELDQHSPKRLTLMGELRQGLETEELFLLYQPKVNGGDGEIRSAEALVRWNHYKHGIIPPNEFIPMAERTGMIKDLSKFVLQKVLKQIAEWEKEGLEISVSVNLSAQDLLDPKLPEVLAGLLASCEVPASRLVVEITETAIIEDPERAMEVMSRLSEMGVKMSIDDFGTGYSSLAYLKKMPVREIKIDRSFVMEMMENGNDAVIVKATIGLAHNLGMKVVAEGVESQESADHLRELGCDTLQGFFYSKPISPEEFIAMANNGKVH
jgi:diguanylate cyclase (GGDEF)-like protein